MDNQSARDRANALLTAWNRRDYGEVASHLSPDVVLVDHARHRTSTGPNGYIERFKRLLDAWPDMQGRPLGARGGKPPRTRDHLAGPAPAPLKIPGYDNVAPTDEPMTMHLVTYMEFDDGGQVKGLRTYGEPGEVPLSGRPVGVG